MGLGLGSRSRSRVRVRFKPRLSLLAGLGVIVTRDTHACTAHLVRGRGRIRARARVGVGVGSLCSARMAAGLYMRSWRVGSACMPGAVGSGSRYY